MKPKRATKELILSRGNTKLTYAYVDASNYKTQSAVIMSGYAGDIEDWRQYLTADPDNPNQFFFPAQVGLKPLQGEFFGSGGDLYDDDHPYHQLWGVEETNAKPTVEFSAQELMDRFRLAAETGWDEEAEGRAVGLPSESPQTRAKLARRTIKQLADDYMAEHDGADPAELGRHIRQWAYEELARRDLDGIAFFDFIVEPACEAYGLDELPD